MSQDPKYVNSLFKATSTNKKPKPNWEMAEDLNRHLSKGHSYGQQVLEKMCSIINHDEMRNAN